MIKFFLCLLFLANSIFAHNSLYDSLRVSKNGYYSQCGQDQFLYENFFKEKADGFFIEIGAYDGIVYSNTKFFENLGWNGICIEPIPDAFEELKKNRNCTCIHGCISNKTGLADFLWVKGMPELLSGLLEKYDPRHLQRIHEEIAEIGSGGGLEIIEMPCFRLSDILENHSIEHIDFLSLDTEGGELEILKSIDFNVVEIDFIDVENNYHDPEIDRFLVSKGYIKIKSVGFDDLYQKVKRAL